MLPKQADEIADMRFSFTGPALLVAQLLTSGCSYMIAYELREDDDVPLYATREAIEAKLGEPKLSQAIGSCQIGVYGYVPPKTWSGDDFHDAFEASATFYGLAEPFAFIYGLVEPSDRLGVVYDPSGEMLHHVVYREETTEEALEKLSAFMGEHSGDCDALSDQAIEGAEESQIRTTLPPGHMGARPDGL